MWVNFIAFMNGKMFQKLVTFDEVRVVSVKPPPPPSFPLLGKERVRVRIVVDFIIRISS